MREYLQFYINGQWVDPIEAKSFEVIDPATEEVTGIINVGSAADVDAAVTAAAEAFKTWSRTSKEERLVVLNRIVEEFEKEMLHLKMINGEMKVIPTQKKK